MMDAYSTLSIGGSDGVQLRLLPETAIGYEGAILAAMREQHTFLVRVYPAINGAPTRSIILTPNTLVTLLTPPVSWDMVKARKIEEETLQEILSTGLLLAPAVE